MEVKESVGGGKNDYNGMAIYYGVIIEEFDALHVRGIGRFGGK